MSVEPSPISCSSVPSKFLGRGQHARAQAFARHRQYRRGRDRARHPIGAVLTPCPSIRRVATVSGAGSSPCASGAARASRSPSSTDVVGARTFAVGIDVIRAWRWAIGCEPIGRDQSGEGLNLFPTHRMRQTWATVATGLSLASWLLCAATLAARCRTVAREQTTISAACRATACGRSHASSRRHLPPTEDSSCFRHHGFPAGLKPSRVGCFTQVR